MFVSYSASYDWLLLARLRYFYKGTYYGDKLTHAQTFASSVTMESTNKIIEPQMWALVMDFTDLSTLKFVTE